jgi:hypothetical protein
MREWPVVVTAFEEESRELVRWRLMPGVSVVLCLSDLMCCCSGTLSHDVRGNRRTAGCAAREDQAGVARAGPQAPPRYANAAFSNAFLWRSRLSALYRLIYVYCLTDRGGKGKAMTAMNLIKEVLVDDPASGNKQAYDQYLQDLQNVAAIH